MKFLVALGFFAFLVSACDNKASPDITQYTLVDLAHTYGEDTLYWPTSPSAFDHEVLDYGMTDGGYFYSSYRFRTPEHGGTHMDAPIHFGEGQETIDQIPLERLFVRAAVIDVRDQASADPDYRLTLEDIKAFEAANGKIAGGAVLLMTGWDQFWPDALTYLGDDTPGDASNLHFPSFGEEAATFLIENRGVILLGLDTASIDYGPSKDFMVHRVAAAHNVPGLENLTGLQNLPPTGSYILALPMKIGGGSGAPVRVVGLISNEKVE